MRRIVGELENIAAPSRQMNRIIGTSYFDIIRAFRYFLMAVMPLHYRYIWPRASRARAPGDILQMGKRTQSTNEIMTLIKRVGLRRDESR